MNLAVELKARVAAVELRVAEGRPTEIINGDNAIGRFCHHGRIRCQEPSGFTITQCCAQERIARSPLHALRRRFQLMESPDRFPLPYPPHRFPAH